MFSILSSIFAPTQITVTWIKSRVGFQGYEPANAVAKWAAYFLRPPKLLPPPNGCISLAPFPSLGKVTSTHTKLLVPKQHHHSIHVTPKALTRPKSYFKWVSNTLASKHYNPQYNMHMYQCPFPSSAHSMNPTSVIPLSAFCTPIQQSFIDAWPLAFRDSIKECSGQKKLMLYTPSFLFPTFLICFSQDSPPHSRSKFTMNGMRS